MSSRIICFCKSAVEPDISDYDDCDGFDDIDEVDVDDFDDLDNISTCETEPEPSDYCDGFDSDDGADGADILNANHNTPEQLESFRQYTLSVLKSLFSAWDIDVVQSPEWNRRSEVVYEVSMFSPTFGDRKVVCTLTEPCKNGVVMGKITVTNPFSDYESDYRDNSHKEFDMFHDAYSSNTSWLVHVIQLVHNYIETCYQ